MDLDIYLKSRASQMTTLQEFKLKTKVLMFDLYGTVVDMQGGLTEAIAPYLEAKGWNGRPDAQYAHSGFARILSSRKVAASASYTMRRP